VRRAANKGKWRRRKSRELARKNFGGGLHRSGGLSDTEKNGEVRSLARLEKSGGRAELSDGFPLAPLYLGLIAEGRNGPSDEIDINV
jgi:hypothetical protein